MIFRGQGGEIFLLEISVGVVASEKSDLNARGAVRSLLNFFFIKCPRFRRFWQRRRTCKGSPLHSDR